MSTPFNRLNPLSAVIKERYLLTKPGSTKETYHIVLDLRDSNISFKVGDSLGIYAQNDPVLVKRVLDVLQTDPATLVTHPRTKQQLSLGDFLTSKVNLSRFLDKPTLSLQEMMDGFSPLLPRFYSVASSLLTHPNEAHLTVVISAYMHGSELRYGVASHFLCHLAEVGKTAIPCYVQPALHFTLPYDDTIPLIMVGPGTGIAPFRGFIQERIARSAAGDHWLFFGERHRAFDFLYEELWTELAQQNKLMLDLAFSRDQNEKVYVQHKLYEKGSQIWKWLQKGAYVYVCGEADPMAKEVEATFVQICHEFGKLTPDEAKKFIKELRLQRRYLVDVY